jgi:pyruvate dehydrogenase E1 component
MLSHIGTVKLGLEQVAKFAERFDIPVTKEDVKQLNFYKPAQDSEEMIYMNTQRQKLGGSLPVRSFELENLQAPELDTFSALLKSSGEREMSTTNVAAAIQSDTAPASLMPSCSTCPFLSSLYHMTLSESSG